MAITAHYIVQGPSQLVQRAVLVAFRRISGAHSGRNMAKQMAAVLRDLHITHKVRHLFIFLSTTSPARD
jgi:hypothetical protein